MEAIFSSTAKGLFRRSIPPIFFRGNPPPGMYQTGPVGDKKMDKQLSY